MKNIVLIGYMGAGKSTVGIQLSDRFQIAFEDTDQVIEKRQNMAVSEIFEKYGEESFRTMETELLAQMAERKGRRVIALGGGTPMRFENRERIKALGIVIYLRARPDTIMERLSGDMSRPLLRGGGARQKIEQMLKERGPVYESLSDLTVDTDGKAFENIVDEIGGFYEAACNKRTEP